jgi:hypothetical protein
MSSSSCSLSCPRWTCSASTHPTRRKHPWRAVVCPGHDGRPREISAYGVGVFAGRTSALACERHLACIAIGGQDRPDLRTISDGRTLHLERFRTWLCR